MTAESPTDRLAASIGLAFGALMHLVVGWFHVVARLVVPMWAWALLLAEWLLLAGLLWRHRSRPVVTLAVPFVSAAVWWGVIAAGEAWLGWSA